MRYLNGLFRFWMKTNFPIEFFNFFSIFEAGHCAPPTPHLPKTEFLPVVSKMAIFNQIFILDIGEIFGAKKNIDPLLSLT